MYTMTLALEMSSFIMSSADCVGPVVDWDLKSSCESDAKPRRVVVRPAWGTVVKLLALPSGSHGSQGLSSAATCSEPGQSV